MGISHFQQGVTLQIDDRQHVMHRQFDDGNWQTEEVGNGRLHSFKLEELQRKYENGSLTFYNEHKPSSKLTDVDSSKIIALRPEPSADKWTQAKIRRTYVTALENLPLTQKLMVPAIQQLWEKVQRPAKPPHWITVLRWKAKYKSHGKSAYALVDRDEAKGNRSRRYPIELQRIIEDAIEVVYLQRERNTVEDTLEQAIVLVKRENDLRHSSMQLPQPSRRMVQGIINEIPAFDRYAARYGRMAAVRKFRAKLRHHVTNAPLESAEIDHTKLDLFVLNDNDLIPLGRPWLTVCIDCHTRCILGVYVGFVPPSYLTVAKCLKHAFLPKTSLHELYPRIDHEWKAHGVMEKLIVDNGLEFHSDSLEKACYAFGVEIEYTPRKTPWFKGKIERFNGTINRSLSHGTPGTTFSNIFEKDDYDPSKHAVVTLSTLREILHMWIADYYHQKPHRALDSLTPAAMWESSIRQTDISLANDPARIDVLLGKTITAKPLTHIGIEVNRLQYNSPELVSLRRQYGSELKVDIRVDEEDVGHLYVMLPDGSGFLEVPAIDKDYAQGVSLWLHNICRNYAKLHLEANNPLNWALAKSVIRDIVQEEMKFKRSKTNSRKGRYIDSEQRSQNSVAKLKRALPKPAPAKAEIVIDFQPSDPVTRPKFTTVIENRGKQS